MKTWIYKGSKREQAYLYLPAPDAFEPVPEPLLDAMGTLELVMEIDLDAHRKLAREDPIRVARNLREQGFHLQMPPVAPKFRP